MGYAAERSRTTNRTAAVPAATVTTQGANEPAPWSTNSVGATRASTTVTVPRTAPGTSTGSRCRAGAAGGPVQVGVARDAGPDAGHGQECDRHVDQQQHLPRGDGQHEAAGGRADR